MAYTLVYAAPSQDIHEQSQPGSAAAKRLSVQRGRSFHPQRRQRRGSLSPAYGLVVLSIRSSSRVRIFHGERRRSARPRSRALMPRYMLDTDTCSYIMRRSPESVIKKLAKVPVSDVCISVITKSELLYGDEASPHHPRGDTAPP